MDRNATLNNNALGVTSKSTSFRLAILSESRLASESLNASQREKWFLVAL